MIRSVLFLASMFLAAITIGVLGLPSLFKREWALGVAKAWCATSLFLLKLFCGIDDRVVGRKNVPEGAALIAAKHQSMWETLRLAVILPRPVFVLKKELAGWPIFSWYCRALGFIFVDRAAGAKTIREMTRHAKERAAEGSQIVIFPEGTRSRPGERLPYQPGVAALAKTLGVPTVPVSHDSGRFWVQPGPRKQKGTITMIFHDPITEVGDRKRYLAELESAIEDQVQEPS